MAHRYRSIVKIFVFISLLLSVQYTFAQQAKKHHHKKPVTEAAQPPGFKFRTVIIDAGHGGKDPGAHGAYSKEKNVTLAIAKKLEIDLPVLPR